MRIIILGNGGHARVCAEALGWPIIFQDNEIGILDSDHLILGMGDLTIRRMLFERFGGHRFITVKHPQSIVSESCKLGAGVQIMAGTVIQSSAKCGDNIILNTRASVDHDCIIGNHCHIAPGAILCGDVTVGEGCFIGAGAIIPEGSVVPAGTFVKAGSVWRGSGA